MTGLVFKQIEKEVAVDFVKKYHYSKIMPRLTKYYLGYFDSGRLTAVVTLGWGTQPLQTIKKLFPAENYTTEDYLEIGKMCIIPELNQTKYFGSKMCADLVRWMRSNTNCSFLYTLADGIMGKCGFVYQASNFIYLGQFKTSVYMHRLTGEKIHPRSAKMLLVENAIFDNVEKRFWLTHGFCEYKGIDKINGLMFRYIYPLNKRAKKALQRQYKVSVPYPKEDSLLFERRVSDRKYAQMAKPEFNMNVFEYNYQKG